MGKEIKTYGDLAEEYTNLIARIKCNMEVGHTAVLLSACNKLHKLLQEYSEDIPVVIELLKEQASCGKHLINESKCNDYSNFTFMALRWHIRLLTALHDNFDKKLGTIPSTNVNYEEIE